MKEKRDVTAIDLLFHSIPAPKGAFKKVFIEILKRADKPLTMKEIESDTEGRKEYVNIRLKQFLEKKYIRIEGELVLITKRGENFLVNKYRKSKKFRGWCDKHL